MGRFKTHEERASLLVLKKQKRAAKAKLDMKKHLLNAVKNPVEN